MSRRAAKLSSARFQAGGRGMAENSSGQRRGPYWTPGLEARVGPSLFQ
jgi:hypothetical protein